MARKIEQWFYTPEYQLVLTDLQGNNYALFTLASAQTALYTESQTGNAVFTMYDFDWRILYEVQPAPMWEVQLYLRNRYGEWAPDWNGLIDSVNQVSDTSSGDQLVISCTTKQKKFDVTYQTPSGATSLSLAYATGIQGTAVLNYCCNQVGFPLSALKISGNPDSGANTWGAISTSNFVDPSQANYTSILQGLLQDSGLEMFFDEEGSLIWRPLAYLNVPSTPRPVNLADVTHYDLGFGDKGVVTTVEVRYGAMPFHVAPGDAGGAYWQAPQEMVNALGTRYYTVTAAWITDNNHGAASYLAKALGQISAANIASGVIVQLADPMFRLGTVIEVPALKEGKSPSYFYVTGKVNNLDMEGNWWQILSLNYGRPKGQSFPYGLNPTTPIPPTGPNSGFQTNTTIPTLNLDGTADGSSQLGRYSSPFKLTQVTSVAKGTVVVDPSLGIPIGSDIQITTKFGSGKKAIGTSAVYTVVKGPSNGMIEMSNTMGYTTGYVTLIDLGQGVDPTTSSPTDGTTTNPYNPGGTGYPAPGSKEPPQPSKNPNPGSLNLAQRALAIAESKNGAQYGGGGVGPNTFDCSGFVYWCYNQAGYKLARMNVGGIYAYFKNLGAPSIPLAQAQPGDLLFFGDMRDPNNQHIGFYVSQDNMIGADNTNWGVRFSFINGFLTEGDAANGEPQEGLSYVLDMQNIS